MKKHMLALTVVLALALPTVSAFAREFGAYDSHHTWQNAEWWHNHHPRWMYEHHPEWAEHYPDWRNEGDFDEHRYWHSREWWLKHHHAWVKEHHADW
jgi:hypothetical protein